MKRVLVLIQKSFRFIFAFLWFVLLGFVNLLRFKKTENIFLIFQSPNYGGTKTYFYYITNFLINRGYKLFLLIKEEEKNTEILNYCVIKNITIFTYEKQNIFENYYYPKSITKSFAHFIYRYIKQVIYLQKIFYKIRPSKTFVSVGWPFIWFISFFLPGSKIYVQHVMPLQKIDFGNRFMMKISLFFSRVNFIAVSDFCRRRMNENWFDNKQNIEVVYNYYQQNQETCKIEKNTIDILTLVRVDYIKNPKLWIDVAKEIIKIRLNVNFVWVGDGEFYEQAKNLTSNFPHINFVGFKTNVDEWYAKSDIYINLAKAETHGISVIGAMCHSLPCLVTNNGGTIESVENNITGFHIEVNNKQEIIDKLLLLIEDKERRIAMGQKARQRYEQMFTKEIWEEKMCKII